MAIVYDFRGKEYFEHEIEDTSVMESINSLGKVLYEQRVPIVIENKAPINFNRNQVKSIVITLDDGRSIQAKLDDFDGVPENQYITQAFINEKYMIELEEKEKNILGTEISVYC